MKPTDEQLQQCDHILLNAFTLNELARLVRADLDLALTAITSSDSPVALNRVIDQLVRYYAAQENGLLRLLTAALRQNPGNHLLRNLLERWQGLYFDPLPLPPDHPCAESSTRGAGHSKGVSFGFDPADAREYLESTSPNEPTDMSFSLDLGGFIGGNVTNTGGGASVGGDAHVGRLK
ncbi:MAG: effector-associated domain EAD1-containing protein [Caldilineaceae bacterium]